MCWLKREKERTCAILKTSSSTTHIIQKPKPITEKTRIETEAMISPFDIVRVENKSDDSVTYGVVQDILHITDGTGHLSNYVSSDFGILV